MSSCSREQFRQCMIIAFHHAQKHTRPEMLVICSSLLLRLFAINHMKMNSRLQHETNISNLPSSRFLMTSCMVQQISPLTMVAVAISSYLSVAPISAWQPCHAGAIGRCSTPPPVHRFACTACRPRATPADATAAAGLSSTWGYMTDVVLYIPSVSKYKIFYLL